MFPIHTSNDYSRTHIDLYRRIVLEFKGEKLVKLEAKVIKDIPLLSIHLLLLPKPLPLGLIFGRCLNYDFPCPSFKVTSTASRSAVEQWEKAKVQNVTQELVAIIKWKKKSVDREKLDGSCKPDGIKWTTVQI